MMHFIIHNKLLLFPFSVIMVVDMPCLFHLLFFLN